MILGSNGEVLYTVSLLTFLFMKTILCYMMENILLKLNS